MTAAGILGFMAALVVLTIRLKRFGLIVRAIAGTFVGGRHVFDPFPGNPGQRGVEDRQPQNPTWRVASLALGVTRHRTHSVLTCKRACAG